MVIPLFRRILYGPVNSRRLGNSLGINLMPANYKLCSFDCLYCHFGWTKKATIDVRKFLKDLPRVDEVVKAVEENADLLNAAKDVIGVASVGSEWATSIFTTKEEPVAPVVVEEGDAAPVVIEPIVEVTVPPATPITPSWIYVIIGVGAVLVIALLVLIVRTRRVA